MAGGDKEMTIDQFTRQAQGYAAKELKQSGRPR
jgi:hypothetical protein